MIASCTTYYRQSDCGIAGRYYYLRFEKKSLHKIRVMEYILCGDPFFLNGSSTIIGDPETRVFEAETATKRSIIFFLGADFSSALFHGEFRLTQS